MIDKKLLEELENTETLEARKKIIRSNFMYSMRHSFFVFCSVLLAFVFSHFLNLEAISYVFKTSDISICKFTDQ